MNTGPVTERQDALTALASVIAKHADARTAAEKPDALEGVKAPINPGTALEDMLDALRRNRLGEQTGICSICSAHPLVLEATLRNALGREHPVLIEATSNQVNHEGGYTGMKPADFVKFVHDIADKVGFPKERIVLGSDHLGPFPYASLPADEAMAHATKMVGEYVRAGFNKIHIDTSMRLGGDAHDMDPEHWELLVARRAARLGQVAEAAWQDMGCPNPAPVYVVGTEVPTPGGEGAVAETMKVTAPSDVERNIRFTREAFEDAGLESAWSRVIAFVVQPGVEFGHTKVDLFDEAAATPLSEHVLQHEKIVFEAHSTDYQKDSGLDGLVKGHFAILKVGPWLTFAMREGLMGLENIEQELIASGQIDPAKASKLWEVTEQTMLDNPKHWSKHYSGTAEEVSFLMQNSLSDRVRYYWNNPPIEAAVARLNENLGSLEIPDELIAKHFPREHGLVQNGAIRPTPRELVLAKIGEVLDKYAHACGVGASE